jgi:hypothetical protein
VSGEEPGPRADLPYLRVRRRPPAVLERPPPAPETAPPLPPATSYVYVPRRTRTGAPTILNATAPTVLLNRIQSGVGALTFEGLWPAAGDLRLCAAYQLRSGGSAAVAPTGEPIASPSRSSGPLVIDWRGPAQRLVLDLLRGSDLDRLIVMATLGAPTELSWTGTLVVTTAGRTRIELPLEGSPAPGVLILASLYNDAGEMVLRAEMADIAGSMRDACMAYGFGQISWLDPNTPLG